MPLRLDRFPVHYPPDVLHGTRPQNQMCRQPWHHGTRRDPEPYNSDRNLRVDSGVIFFGRSFGQDRPQPSGRTIPAHGAIDIFGAYGCEIRASVTAEVQATWRASGRTLPGVNPTTPGIPTGGTFGGNYIMARDADGYWHYYAHMQWRVQLAAGDTIHAGQVIGELGATGLNRRHQHLHYQVSERTARGTIRRNINPYDELRRLALELRADRRLNVHVNTGGRVIITPADGSHEPYLEDSFSQGCVEQGHWNAPVAPTPGADE